MLKKYNIKVHATKEQTAHGRHRSLEKHLQSINTFAQDNDYAIKWVKGKKIIILFLRIEFVKNIIQGRFVPIFFELGEWF